MGARRPMPRSILRTVLLMSTALTVMNTVARADDQSATTTEENRSDAQTRTVELPAVEVSARQWKEDLQQVPGSVSVLSGEDLEKPLWNSVAAVSKVAPNVEIEQSSVETRVVMRGMTSANTALQDPVGYFINDVALPLGASQAPQLFDIERMEILKGPQGSLYGRNTEAGAIKVFTKDPSWTPSAWGDLSTSFKDGANGWIPSVIAGGGVSGALVDQKLAASLAVRMETSNGVYRNLYDGADNGGKTDRWALSSGFAWQAGPDTDVTLKSVTERDDLGKERMRYLTGPYATARYTTDYNTKSWDDKTTSVQALKVEHHFNDVDLTTVSGWTHFDHDFQMDLDTSPKATLPTTLSHRDDALSQEVRLSSSDTSARVRWLGGLYTYREWASLDYRSGTPTVRRQTDIDQTGWAGFGQVEVGLTDRLKLGVGSRLEWVGQEGDLALTTSTGTSRYQRDLNEVTVLPRFTLSYELQPETMIYGSYARGYLPGGYNYSMARNADSLAYDPEYSWTAEMGAKSRFGVVDGGLAFFDTRTRDKQIIDLIPGGTQKVSNAARAEIYGAELSLDAHLSDRWKTFSRLGWQHAEATSYTTDILRGGSLVATDLSGKRLPMAADVTYSIGIRYDEGEGWFGQTSVTGSGPYYFDSQNTLKQSGFAMLDGEIGYRFPTVEVSLWAANITNQNVYSRAVSTTAGAIVEDGIPREVGLRIKAQW